MNLCCWSEQAISDAILLRASADELTHIAIAEGMQTLFADGIRKAAEGETTLEEIWRTASVSY